MSSDQLAGIKSLPGIVKVCLGKSFRESPNPYLSGSGKFPWKVPSMMRMRNQKGNEGEDPSGSSNTLPETNIAPENGWLEDAFPFGMAYFQVLC